MTATPSLSDAVERVRRRLDPTASGAPSIENYADPAEVTDDMVALCDAVDRLLADLKEAGRAGAARARQYIVVRQARLLDELIVGGVVLDAEGVAWQGRVISTWDEDGVPESCDAWVCCEDGGWATSEGVLERGPVTVLHDPRPSRDSYGLNSGRESRDPGPPAPDGPGERS